jgi:hypothetical protein
MTTTRAPAPAGPPAPAPDDEAACRQAAKQLRRKHPAWLVIWVTHTSRYHAWLLATTRAGDGLSDTSTAGLAAQIEQADRAAAARRARPRPGASTG